MTLRQDEIDRWAQFAETVRTTTLSLAPKTVEPIQSELIRLHLAAALALSGMEEAGASTPQSLPSPESVPLHLLDTPTNRRFALRLREAYEAAREVDQERGYGDDGPADYLADLLARVEIEIYGPTGSGE